MSIETGSRKPCSRTATRCRSASIASSSIRAGVRPEHGPVGEHGVVTSAAGRPDARGQNRQTMSIGAVLALLRPEFPDVSISKIRFLEDQGLVEPERTPAGYRKFGPQDVDRLRYVLGVQRD